MAEAGPRVAEFSAPGLPGLMLVRALGIMPAAALIADRRQLRISAQKSPESRAEKGRRPPGQVSCLIECPAAFRADDNDDNKSANEAGGRMSMFKAGGEGQARMKNHIPPG